MLLTCVRMEGRKLRHSWLWLVFMVIPVIPAVMGGGNYMMNQEALQAEWYSLWTQCSLFYSNFFYGPLVALYCSYIWRVEHLNHNWNQLMTMPVPFADIFLSKLYLALGCTVFHHHRKDRRAARYARPADPALALKGMCRGHGHCSTAASAFHGNPKLCSSDCSGASGQCDGAFTKQRRYGAFLAVFADAYGDECQ